MSVRLPAMVLTAGLGTRLRPLTRARAKAAMPVAGEPIIHRIIRWLVANGMTDIVLNLHHRPETISGIVGDGSDLAARVRYTWEHPRILGPAGGPRQALDTLNASRFVLVNGDTITDLELEPLEAAHARSGALVTMALVPNRWPNRYGGVQLDGKGRVTGFAPKGRADGTFHFFGVQIVEARVFAELPAGEFALSIGGLYDKWIAQRSDSIRGLVCDAAFWDVGTVEDYWSTSWDVGARESAGSLIAGRSVRLSPESRVTRSILWDNVEVSSGAVLDECIVTDNVSVPAGAEYRRTILLRGADAALQNFPLPL